jgi:uncharacterized protein with NAD-binding domain and iron-sulfur cluster
LPYRVPAHPIPPVRIVKERRATFLASPAQLLRRPGTKTKWSNLLLAGDYVDTGLPATIEGAVASGVAAAREVVASALVSRRSIHPPPVGDAQTAELEAERVL